MSVYRRKGSKIFTANLTIKGKRYSFSTGETSKRAAKAVEAHERQRILKQSKLTPQELGAKTLLLTAIEQVYDQRWSHTKDSQRSYKRAINLASIIGNIPLSDITDTTILHLIKTLESRGNSNATVNRYLTCLKTILKQLKQPVGGIKLRKEPKGRVRVISKEEEANVLSLLRSEQGERRYYFQDVADLVEVLVDTGMRLGEALALRYEDVNYGTNLISIWINKGDRPRSIPMTKRVHSILEARQSGNPVKPFTMIKSYQVSTAWSWVRKEMGLKDDDQFVPHALRHTCASRLVNAGVDLYLVKEILGHSTIQVTERYAHLSKYRLATAIETLND